MAAKSVKTVSALSGAGRKFKLDGAIDEIVEFLIEGKTYRYIADHFGVSLGCLHNYISLDEHSARTGKALQISALSYADKAEEVLQKAEKDPIEMTRARELAQHYRWAAKCRNPKGFGDSTTIRGDAENPLHAKTEITDKTRIGIDERIKELAGLSKIGDQSSTV